MPKTITHDGHAAHLDTPILRADRRNNFNWCENCRGWFEPISMSPTELTAIALNCDRCGKTSTVTTMSMFNTQTICMDCKATETQRPDYAEAVKAEADAVRSGNYNFPGIGLRDK